MAKAMSPATKREADALLTVVKMAERHQLWPLMGLLLDFIREAGAGFAYLAPETYAIITNPEPIKDPL